MLVTIPDIAFYLTVEHIKTEQSNSCIAMPSLKNTSAETETLQGSGKCLLMDLAQEPIDSSISIFGPQKGAATSFIAPLCCPRKDIPLEVILQYGCHAIN